METLAMMKQVFGEESLRRTRKVKFKLTEPEKVETGEEQSQEHAHFL
jgi:hypothetical protein